MFPLPIFPEFFWHLVIILPLMVSLAAYENGPLFFSLLENEVDPCDGILKFSTKPFLSLQSHWDGGADSLKLGDIPHWVSACIWSDAWPLAAPSHWEAERSFRLVMNILACLNTPRAHLRYTDYIQGTNLPKWSSGCFYMLLYSLDRDGSFDFSNLSLLHSLPE